MDGTCNCSSRGYFPRVAERSPRDLLFLTKSAQENLPMVDQNRTPQVVISTTERQRSGIRCISKSLALDWEAQGSEKLQSSIPVEQPCDNQMSLCQGGTETWVVLAVYSESLVGVVLTLHASFRACTARP